MANIDITIQELKTLLEEIKDDIDQIDRDISGLQYKRTELQEEANIVSQTLYFYEKRHSRLTEAAPAVDVSAVHGAKTQEEALILLAKREASRRIKVGEAWPYLIGSGLMKPLPQNKAYVNTYSVLSRSDHFTFVAPGEFELVNGETHLSEPEHLSARPERNANGKTLTQIRAEAISSEARKFGGYIRHGQAVTALNQAGLAQSAKQHALNILTQKRLFEKVDKGLYRLRENGNQDSQTNQTALALPSARQSSESS